MATVRVGVGGVKGHGVCLESTALRDITHTPCGAAAHCTREYTRNTKIYFVLRPTHALRSRLFAFNCLCLPLCCLLASLYLSNCRLFLEITTA